MRTPNSLPIDSPAWPLLQAHVSYWGTTTANGNVLGTTIVEAGLANEPSYQGLAIKLLDGAAAGQVRPVAAHIAGTNILGVVEAFTDNAGAVVQVVAGTRFVILSSVAGGGAGPVPPSIGLWMFGVVSATAPLPTWNIPCLNLAGFPDLIFDDEFWMQVIHNADAPGTAPEREIRRITNYQGVTGLFQTDPFSAAVEIGDLVCIFHESIMSIEILGFGTLTVSSTTVPADGGRAALYAWENNDYFKGCLLMPTEGNCRFQPRPIASFTVAGGIFGLDEPFSQLPGQVDYVIIGAAYPYQKLTDILTRMGVATDNGDLPTLFAKHKQEFLGIHTHVLVIVHDTAALDADLDTALQAWLLDAGFAVTLADPTDVAGNLEVSAFDLMIVSASCVAADAGNLANLREADVPIICHSADIAASAVFSLGATPHTEAAQTQIEIVDNTVMWLVTQALGDLTVQAAANIYAMNTKAANATTFAEEATGTGNHLTIVRLLAGDEDGAAIPYAPFYDRYFVGVADYTNMNAVWRAIMAQLAMHCVMEKRFTEEAVVKAKGMYVEDIPDTDFALAAIDTVLTNPPPAADAENSIVDLDAKNKTTYVLRSMWFNVTSFGTGTQLTFGLWTLLNGAVTQVDSVVVAVLGVQNLMDLFDLPEIYANGIWITVITDVGNTGACSGTFNYAEAKS